MWVPLNLVLLVLVCGAFSEFSGKVVDSESEIGGKDFQLHRQKRQLGLGNIFNPGGNQNQGRRGPSCQTPSRQKGKCVPMDQCVLKELDDDYVKNKGYLCLIRSQGPVGVCCPDSIAKPVVYREGMFGNKNTVFARTGEDTTQDVPQDVEMLN